MCQQTHDTLRKQKTSDCFLVGIPKLVSCPQSHQISQILSTKSIQQNCGITVTILKNSLP